MAIRSHQTQLMLSCGFTFVSLLFYLYFWLVSDSVNMASPKDDQNPRVFINYLAQEYGEVDLFFLMQTLGIKKPDCIHIVEAKGPRQPNGYHKAFVDFKCPEHAKEAMLILHNSKLQAITYDCVWWLCLAVVYDRKCLMVVFCYLLHMCMTCLTCLTCLTCFTFLRFCVNVV